jgi:hypothetical protein
MLARGQRWHDGRTDWADGNLCPGLDLYRLSADRSGQRHPRLPQHAMRPSRCSDLRVLTSSSHPPHPVLFPETTLRNLFLQTSSNDSSELSTHDPDPWRMYIASPHTFEAKTQGGNFLLAHATRDAASRPGTRWKDCLLGPERGRGTYHGRTACQIMSCLEREDMSDDRRPLDLSC